MVSPTIPVWIRRAIQSESINVFAEQRLHRLVGLLGDKQRLMFKAAITMLWCRAYHMQCTALRTHQLVRGSQQCEQDGWTHLNVVFNADGPIGLLKHVVKHCDQVGGESTINGLPSNAR